MSSRLCLVVTFVMLFACRDTQGEKREIWSYERLEEASTVIVLASLVKTSEADNKLIDAGYRDKLDVKVSTFKVERLIKGKLDFNAPFDVVHVQYRKDAKRDPDLNPVQFKSYEPYRRGKAKGEIAVEYLLHLVYDKKTERYVAASGLLRTGLSVKVLHDETDE